MTFFIGFIFGSLAGMLISALCIASAQTDRKDYK